MAAFKTDQVHQGRPFDRGHIYKMLHHKTYLGQCDYKGTAYPGEHPAIIGQDLWDRVHASNHRAKGNLTRRRAPGFLKGVTTCAHCGHALTLTWVKARNGTRHRYYRCVSKQKRSLSVCPTSAIPAGQLEGAVLAHIRRLLQAPAVAKAIADRANHEAHQNGAECRHSMVVAALGNLDTVWEELFPLEQQRIAELLIANLTVGVVDTVLTLKLNGLQEVLRGLDGTYEAAALQQVVHLPIQAIRRSGRRRMIIRPSTEVPEAVADPMPIAQDPIALALARAHRWLDEIEGPQRLTIVDIAKREKVDAAYIRRHLRLAPQVIEALPDKADAGASLSKMMKGEMEEVWGEQKAKWSVDEASQVSQLGT